MMRIMSLAPQAPSREKICSDSRFESAAPHDCIRTNATDATSNKDNAEASATRDRSSRCGALQRRQKHLDNGSKTKRVTICTYRASPDNEHRKEHTSNARAIDRRCACKTRRACKHVMRTTRGSVCQEGGHNMFITYNGTLGRPLKDTIHN